MSVLSSREFNQDTARAKRAAREGPVFITDRGRPSLVLLSIEDYRRLAAKGKSLLEQLQMDEDIEFDPPRMDWEAIPADLS